MRTCTFFFLFFLPVFHYAQHFTFLPSESVSTELEMDVFTDTQVDVVPLTDDTLLISWRMVENTCPSDWDFVLCDWAACYDYLPNHGEMDPVWEGSSGLLKLTANPHNTPGSGFVRFWVYPTGLMNERQEVFFYYDTTVASTVEVSPLAPMCFPSPANQEVEIRQLSSGEYRIYSSFGHWIKTFYVSNNETVRLDVANWPSGLYIVNNATFSFSFLVHH
jgi:hypothetical protein